MNVTPIRTPGYFKAEAVNTTWKPDRVHESRAAASGSLDRGVPPKCLIGTAQTKKAEETSGGEFFSEEGMGARCALGPQLKIDQSRKRRFPQLRFHVQRQSIAGGARTVPGACSGRASRARVSPAHARQTCARRKQPRAPPAESTAHLRTAKAKRHRGGLSTQRQGDRR